jgi:hypothetical protein
MTLSRQFWNKMHTNNMSYKLQDKHDSDRNQVVLFGNLKNLEILRTPGNSS